MSLLVVFTKQRVKVLERLVRALECRYVMLVYRQPSTVDFAQAKSTLTRMAFDIAGWTGALGLGDPVHATYFLTGFECGCNLATLMSVMFCTFCCWTPPSDDFHERAGSSRRAESSPLTGGASASGAAKTDAEEFA